MPLRNQSEKIDLLKTVPLFGGLSNRHLGMLARCGQEKQFSSGRVMTRQGGVGREVFIIVEGRARVERDGRLIARLQRDDCFGEMSLLDGEPRSATVTSDGDVVVFAVVSKDFGEMIVSVPGLARKMLAALSIRLRTADIQLATRN